MDDNVSYSNSNLKYDGSKVCTRT